jgi:hypothetical protein
LLYTNSQPGYSETGLRGLTCVADPEGSEHVLLAAVEGTVGRIVRIDPKTGAERTEVNVNTLLGEAWGTRLIYVISAYNGMAVVPAERDGQAARLLIGIEAKFAKGVQIPEGRTQVAGFDGGGWYLLRDSKAHYGLHKIGDRHPGTGRPLVSTREILVSPFGDRRLYFAGYDANKVAAHNTAWVVSAPEDAATQP